MFETEKEVLDWYERQPRSLSKGFVDSIEWCDVTNHDLDPAFVPVLFYMRDVEYFTDIYYKELRRTPTGKDPIIRKFMDRWSVEENQHADLLKVLKTLLAAIIHEESLHSSFYWNVARVKLNQSKFSRDLARFIVGHFWTPVGQGAKPAHETNYVIATLFRGANGLEFFSRMVADRIARLPGFAGFTALSERIEPIVQA